MSGKVKIRFRDGIALVSLGTPGEKVNMLTEDFLRDLEDAAHRLLNHKNIRGVVVRSTLKRGFFVGADIQAIANVSDPGQGTEFAREGQRIFNLWAELPFPVVAAIHGHCLGGGTEFALACHFRVAAANAVFGLPEVKIGIFPGFGGTQRLPRLISLEKTLDIILSGRSVRAGEALRIGLVDRVVPTESLLEEALTLAQQTILSAEETIALREKKRRGWRRSVLEKNPIGRAILFARARKDVEKKTRGHYPAPLKALEVIRQGLSLPLQQGLEMEAREIGPLVVSDECKNLIHVFHLSQRARREFSGDSTLPPLRKAAVIGAGIMGSGIAQLLAARGVSVILKDIQPEAVQTGIQRARENLRAQLARREQPEEVIRHSLALISGMAEDAALANVDLVIEAVVEDLAIKQQVLREMEGAARKDTVFATNTSALSVGELQSAARHPERVGGMHFFNPVERMPLVEIIRGEKTSDRTLAALFQAANHLGKTPIIVADSPGFLVNRLLGALLSEACLLADEGIDWVSLDKIVRNFGFPMGPFRLLDEIGIDIAAEVGMALRRTFPYLPGSRLMEQMLSKELKGKKGGKGFYIHGHGRSRPNPELENLPGLKRVRQAGDIDLQRLVFLMTNEAGRCLEEGVVATPEDVDTGMIFGAGFPPFRGGLCRWSDACGFPRIISALGDLADQNGPRFEPCAFLADHSSFYPTLPPHPPFGHPLPRGEGIGRK